MLKGLILNNIQSHKSTELQFSEGMNIIVGPTDSGKSGVLRGLNWVLNNKPSGESLVSFWCKNSNNNQNEDISASVILEDGIIITRIRQPKANKYILENGSEISEYGAIGSEVPDSIRNKFNVSDINIQNQHDQPFLLFDTAGEVSRTLNRVVKLESIDKSLSNLESKKRANNAEINITNQNIDYLDIKLSKYDGLDNFEKDVCIHEGLVLSLDTISSTLRNIRFMLDEYNDIANKMGSKEQVDLFYTIKILVPRIEELRTTAHGHYVRYDTLLDIMERYITISRLLRSKDEIDNIYALLKSLEYNRNSYLDLGIKADNLFRVIEEIIPLMEYNSDAIVTSLKLTEDLDIKYSAYRTISWEYSELSRLISSLLVEDHNVKITSVALRELIASLPEECPYCGNIMEDDICKA